MVKRLSLIGGLVLLAIAPVVQGALAVPGDPIDNVEQRVSEHGFRFGAEQFLPDVSGNVLVWQDQRGDSQTFLDPVTKRPRNRIWSKNLGTRDELPITTLATQFGHPRVSGSLVVWHDFEGGDHDVFARRVGRLPIVQLTPHSADQTNPAIDGTLVVWEDDRNGNLDIFRKSAAGGAESAVVVASGNQASPSISGTTVAWRDSRRGPGTADVWVRTGDDPAAQAVLVTSPGVVGSFSAYQVAVSGTRLLWNEADPACTFDCRPKILKTCVLPCAPASIVQVDSVPSDPDEVRRITDLDVSGSRAGWGDLNTLYTVDLATCDVPPCAPKTQVGSLPGGAHLATGNAHLDGQRFAWAEGDPDVVGLEGGLDIRWDDVLNAAPPRRANSLGLGPFAQHLSPAADGDFVVYRAPGEGDTLNQLQVWATDLSGTRRHFAVSTELGTDTSRPAIVGQRAAWSDLRNCPAAGGPQIGSPCLPGDPMLPNDDVFQRVPLDSGAEARLSDPVRTGGPVDADGSSTAWRCGSAGGVAPTAICVHDGTSLQRIDVSGRLLDPASTITNLVRISGDLVVWHELLFSSQDPEQGENARVHVLDVETGDDEIVGEGLEVVGEFPDFDVSGSTVVWAHQGDIGEPPVASKIWRSEATGCGGTGSQCDHTGAAATFETAVLGRVLSSPSLDGDRVAWTDCDPFSASESGDCEVFTRTLAESESHVVTNDTDAFVQSPFVDDALDRIYWVDGREGAQDVFMESVSGAALPGPDTTPPASPTGFTATRLAGSVQLAWVNPTGDFFRVRILRRSGRRAPTLDDRFASVVYEGSGTTFTDTDVTPTRQYSYAIFAFDLEPNYSSRAVASTVTPITRRSPASARG